jgi:reversibly glycosylated polypeptide/UDP-arabinopyranose mutase
MNALVIPSIRENSLLEFLNSWDNVNLELFIVEDNPTKQFRLVNESNHFSWKEIEETLGNDAWIISHRDSAIRSFGFLMAYRSGAEYIYTLDDDCLPVNDVNDFVQEHQNALQNNSRWTESYPGRRTRGCPYRNKGNLRNVMLNMGLWTGHPDLDSVQTLNGDADNWTHEFHATRIMPVGQYFPLCGMNMCFKRELTPLMYFPLMGEGYEFRRFDDIWCGIIMKKVCDHLGLLVTCGTPYIIHNKASDPFVNLVKEAPGIAANENFWKIIDDIPLRGENCIECMAEIGEGLKKKTDQYFQKLGKAIVIWSHLFQSIE